MSFQKIIIIITLLIGANFFASFAKADEGNYKITIQDHRFSPTELVIPANQKVKVIVENLDSTPEEFESFQLNREKVVSGGGKITIFIGPLKSGSYKYFGDFHKDIAQGVILVKETEK